MKPQIYRKLFFCPVQNNQNDASVCIFIGNRLYLICVYRMGDPHASGTQIMGDVIKTVKGRLGEQPFLSFMEKTGSMTVISNIIRTALFIQTEIPVMKHTHSMIEVPDQLMKKRKTPSVTSSDRNLQYSRQLSERISFSPGNRFRTSSISSK